MPVLNLSGLYLKDAEICNELNFANRHMVKKPEQQGVVFKNTSKTNKGSYKLKAVSDD